MSDFVFSNLTKDDLQQLIEALIGGFTIPSNFYASKQAGLPAGGLAGNVLVKNSDTDYDYTFVHSSDLSVNPFIVGEIRAFAFDVSSDGWLLCDGSSLLCSDYPLLFSLIGVSFGAGVNPSTNAVDDNYFCLPNFTDKFLRGSLSAGAVGGSAAVTLANNQVPYHQHDLDVTGKVKLAVASTSSATATPSNDCSLSIGMAGTTQARIYTSVPSTISIGGTQNFGGLTSKQDSTFSTDYIQSPISTLPPYISVFYFIRAL